MQRVLRELLQCRKRVRPVWRHSAGPLDSWPWPSGSWYLQFLLLPHIKLHRKSQCVDLHHFELWYDGLPFPELGCDTDCVSALASWTECLSRILPDLPV